MITNQVHMKVFRLIFYIVILASLILNSCDQSKTDNFNLDFEKVDPVNKSRPAHWAFSNSSDYAILLDSINAHSGKYSLKIKNTKSIPMSYGGSASIQLEGVGLEQNVKISGYLKTEETTVDSIGLFIAYQNTYIEKIVTITDNDLTGSHPWQKFTLDTKIDSEPELLFVGVFLVGKGTLWVDDLCLYVDDKLINRNPDRQEYVINKTEVAWLKSHSSPIYTVEAKNGFEDLEPMKKLIGEARIVALGENTHGTSEVFKMKHRLVEFLTTEMGFTIFSIEANMPEAYRINDYILHGTGDAKELLAGMHFWTWNTKEVLDLIEWMREMNNKNGGNMQFTGFDMQYFHVALENLINFSINYDNFLKSEVDSLSLLLNNLTHIELHKEASSEDIELIMVCQKKCQSIISYMEQQQDQFSFNNQQQYNWGFQNAQIIHQFLELKRDKSVGFSFRDQCMADNIAWILDNNPDSKIIIWAHNGHINYQKGAMGSFLSKQYDDHYYAIGFLSGSGTYTAKIISGGVVSNNVLAESQPGSYEYNFKKTGIPRFFFDFSNIDKSEPNSSWLSRRLNYRSIGALATEKQFYPGVLSEKFDAIIYLESTNASDCFVAKQY